ncbi:hypothetical protein IKS57_06060, partial [bacterium]|nr:hypothetical protein [bacterium]
NNTESKYLLPAIFFNALNVETNNEKQLQQFFIIPLGFKNLNEVFIATNKIFHNLKKTLNKNNETFLIDGYGAFVPKLKNLEAYIELLIKVITDCGYKVGNNGNENEIALAINFKANKLYDPINKLYQLTLPINVDNLKSTYNQNQFYDLVLSLINKYHFLCVQDPFSMFDTQNYVDLTKNFSNNLQITADEIYSSNPYLIKLGLEKHLTNSVLIKLDEVATLSEIIEAVLYAKKAN